MSQPRLSLALAAPDAIPAAGRIAVFNPPGGADLSDLPRDRIALIQGFRPDYEALAARGFPVAPRAEGDFAAAVLFLPRAKAQARALIAEACARVAPGGPVWIDGAKAEGVDSVLKEARARAPISDPIAKAHGKIFSLAADPAPFADWAARPFEAAPGFVTLPGVFSADGVDEGSALLAACLPDELPARVADLGAGWGWLTAQILTRPGVEAVDMIEADHDAVDCARRNITDPRARAVWADATRFSPEARYGAVVMNPPFHTGRDADPALGAAFIRAAGAMLSLSGTLWMVANRHLPYEDILERHFHEVEEITPPGGRSGRFRIIRAAKPIVGAAKAAPAARAVGAAAVPSGRASARGRRRAR